MYLQKRWQHGDVIEQTCYTNGRFGQKDAEYIRKGGATPLEQLKWQEKNNIRKVWRLLDDNFSHGDFWVTFTFRREYRPEDNEEAKKIIQKFLKSLRRLYRKNNRELKYIMSCGRGERGGIHFHMVMNKFPHQEQIMELWNRYANHGEYSVNRFTPLEKTRNYHKLAAYIIKNGREDFGRIDKVFGKRFSYSTNLVIKPVKAKKIHARTWSRKEKQIPGYYICKDLSHEGIDIAGYPYRYTVYIKLEPGRKLSE